MKTKKYTPRCALALALAVLMVLSTVTAVGYSAILSAFAAESVDKYAPMGLSWSPRTPRSRSRPVPTSEQAPRTATRCPPRPGPRST